MTRVALKGLLQRKLRGILTALAVMLGVAMVSGTFMLTDSIEKAFTSIFNSGYAEADVVISGRPLVEGASSGSPVVPERVLSDVRSMPDVEAAAGTLMDLESNSNNAKLIGRDGRPITTGDSPSLGLGMDPTQPQFTPMQLSEGDWPVGSGKIVIDAATAKSAGFEAGETIGVAAGGVVSDYQITGIATFGDVESLGGATIGVFDVAVARELFNKDGYDSISVTGRDGVSTTRLLQEIRPLLPGDVKVETSAARAAADSKEVTTFISYLRYALLAFGGHRAVRRWLRHLQHAVHHRRPAHPRAGDAAHTGRLEASGDGIGCRRDGGHRHPRLTGGTGAGLRVVARPQQRVQLTRSGIARSNHRDQDTHDRDLTADRHRHHAGSRRAARVPRHPDRTDQRRPGGGDRCDGPAQPAIAAVRGGGTRPGRRRPGRGAVRGCRHQRASAADRRWLADGLPRRRGREPSAGAAARPDAWAIPAASWEGRQERSPPRTRSETPAARRRPPLRSWSV